MAIGPDPICAVAMRGMETVIKVARPRLMKRGRTWPNSMEIAPTFQYLFRRLGHVYGLSNISKVFA